LPGSQAGVASTRVLDGHDTLLISKDILAELLTTLAGKFSRDNHALSHVVVVLAEAAEVVTQRRRLRVLTDDPDNRILECAEAGGADCIVTGDKAMLKLGSYEEIRILSLRQYLSKSLS
jgi:uncharacterized protein